MPKPMIVAAGLIGAAVIIGAAVVVTNKKDAPEDSKSSTSQTQTKQAKLDDPDGVYKLFSDPSVTKHPADNVKFGNGQTLTFEYDGSKTGNDEYATLSYQLFYIQDNGGVIAMGGGNIEGTGKGTFTLSNKKVFDSSAKGRQGFLELEGTYDTSVDGSGKISGKNVKLGMYSVDFDITD